MKLKTYFFCLMLLLTSCFTCFGQPKLHSVTLAWDAMNDPTIAGFNLYYGVSSRSYTNAVSVDNMYTGVVTGLVEGVTYFFAVTASDTNGLESDFSNEISWTVIPFNITYLGVRVEWWTNMAYISKQTFDLKSFTNAPIPQFYRSFLVITNHPF